MRKILFRMPLAISLATASPFAPIKSAAGQEQASGICLALLTDVSSSVSGMKSSIDTPGNYGLQRDGTAAALVSREVVEPFVANGGGFVGYFEFADSSKLMVPFQRLRNEADMRDFSQRVAAVSRSSANGGTSISEGVLGAMREMDKVCLPGMRRVIDVSGDGHNNRGVPMAQTRDYAVQRGYIINGLPILAAEPDILDRYRSEVITPAAEREDGSYQPAGFALLAEGYENYALAIRRKLVFEIAGIRPGEAPIEPTEPGRPANWPVQGLPVKMAGTEISVCRL